LLLPDLIVKPVTIAAKAHTLQVYELTRCIVNWLLYRALYQFLARIDQFKIHITLAHW